MGDSDTAGASNTATRIQRVTRMQRRLGYSDSDMAGDSDRETRIQRATRTRMQRLIATQRAESRSACFSDRGQTAEDSSELESEERAAAREHRARVCTSCGKTNGPADDSDWSEEHCFYCFAGGLKPKYRCPPGPTRPGPRAYVAAASRRNPFAAPACRGSRRFWQVGHGSV